MGYANAIATAREELKETWGKHRSHFKEIMNRDRVLFDEIKGFCSELAGSLKAASRGEVFLHHSNVVTSPSSLNLTFGATFEIRDLMSDGQEIWVTIKPDVVCVGDETYAREDVDAICSYIGRVVCDKFNPLNWQCPS